MRTETVRPQSGERCESQSVCDSALSVKSDGNDIELNGETNDEDMEDGEAGFDGGSAQARNIRDPGQPTDHSSTTQIMVPVLRDGTWCELAAQEIGCSRRFGRGAARVDGLQISRREGI